MLYVTDVSRGIPSHMFEHLSCFLPGLLTLGAQTLSLSAADKELHTWAAQGLAYTCWITYADQETGLGPDEMKMTAWSTDEDQGRWLPHLERWRKQGVPAGVPPGLRQVPQERDGRRDYQYSKRGYLLRPEVFLRLASPLPLLY